MNHTTNIQDTIKVLRDLGIDEDTALRAAGALDDAGLVTPDLPDPYEMDVWIPTWTVGETTVASEPDCTVTAVGSGVARLFQDLDALDDYALALLAAGKWARARARQEAGNMPGGIADVYDQRFCPPAGFFTY